MNLPKRLHDFGFRIYDSMQNHYVRRYHKYGYATMVNRDIYRANLELAESIAHLPGVVVECGVWRGGMIAGIADTLGPDRSYYLFDSFEGLPPATAIDGKAALTWQKEGTDASYFNNCTASLEEAQATLARSAAKKVEFVKGWFDKTLPGRTFPEPIALLRLDGDWYESTMTCLENLYPQMASGGLLLIDDYYHWEGCSLAVHDYLSRNKLTARICVKEPGLVYIVKP